jgi:WbqC-like protein family
MRVAISQPEHFPYLGFFQKMTQSDLFVLLDDVQFSGRGTFQNRNRIRESDGSTRWFTVPVAKGSYMQRLDHVAVSPDEVWRVRLLRRLRYHFGKDFASVYKSENLCDINIQSINLLRGALAINVPMLRSSSLGCSGTKSVRLAQICNAVGARTYICGSGGAAYIDMRAFGNVTVEFFHEEVPDYLSTLCHINSEQLERGLSMIAPEQTRKDIHHE